MHGAMSAEGAPEGFVPRPPDQRRLDGRRALVTGADSGIGQGVAYELAANGAAVAINYLGDPATAGDMTREITGAGGKAIAVKMDVTSEEDVEHAFAAARKAFGGLDLLVNNAGIEKPFRLVDMPLEWWRRVIDVNLTGVFLGSRSAARIMLDDGVPGAIVNITSVHEQIPWRRFSHYCASKGARSSLRSRSRASWHRTGSASSTSRRGRSRRRSTEACSPTPSSGRRS